jgi:hypothetical protein
MVYDLINQLTGSSQVPKVLQGIQFAEETFITSVKMESRKKIVA